MSLRPLLTVILSLLILSLLGWQHFHGGVPAHHLLQNKDLPEISNWWGALLLPVMSWFLAGRMEKRWRQEEKEGIQKSTLIFLCGLALGGVLAVSFTLDFQPFLENVPYLILVLALLVPIYYSEFILGFVLGMTYTFGAVLPTIFMLVMAGFGYLIYRLVHRTLLRSLQGLTNRK